MGKQTAYRYQSFDEDVVFSKGQQFSLPDDYRWIRDSSPERLKSAILYHLAKACGRAYLHAHLRWKLCGDEARSRAQAHTGGIVLFCNHTQPIGDVFAPAFAVAPRRIYTLVSPANLGIPIIGRLLGSLGALPVPSSRRGLERLREAAALRLSQGACIVIYPEAHVWPYCTFIRPFPATSFSFATDNNAPVFCLTTTYRTRGRNRKPQAVAHLDGPFRPEEGLSRHQAKESLRRQVDACMRRRSQESTCEYIRYEKVGDAL